MGVIARLYDFVAGTRIRSANVDAEFDQLVSAHNDHDATISNIAAGTGLTDGSVTLEKMAAASVGTTQLVDLSVTRPKIAIGAVGTSQLDPTLLASYGDIAVQAEFDRRGINPMKYGAVGDGITDDTAAIRAANLSGYQKARASNVQTSPTASMNIFIPSGIYRVKGNKIFGSPLAEGVVGVSPAIHFTLTGDKATILWELDTAEDILFYFDGSITMPNVSGITIIPVSENQTISIGGTIFKYYSNDTLGYSDSSKGLYQGISVSLGRATANTNFTTRIKRIFYNIGDAMSDQTLVQDCRFDHFETCYRGENANAVNWVFDSCGFFGGGFTSSIYFDFTSLYDNFVVKNCSFSVSQNETLLKNRSTLDGAGKYNQSAHYNFIFRNNRIEIYGSVAQTWNACDINFGRFVWSDSNLRLGSGSSNVKTIVSAYGLGNFICDNISFNSVEFRFPILISAAIVGVASAFGSILRNCDFLTTTYDYFKYYDGTTTYSLQDTLISTSLIYKYAKIEACTITNSNGFLDFEIVNTQVGNSIARRSDRTVTYSQNGVALGLVCRIPPYQTIKNIKISGTGTLLSSYTKFRIYFGDRSLANFIDVANPMPDTQAKTEFMLWEGIATIFNSDTTLHSISVFIVDGSTEIASIRSQISVTYEPLDTRIFSITTNPNTIVVKTKSNILNTGTTAQRPAVSLFIGQFYFDTTLVKPIWWNGSVWKDATGTTV